MGNGREGWACSMSGCILASHPSHVELHTHERLLWSATDTKWTRESHSECQSELLPFALHSTPHATHTTTHLDTKTLQVREHWEDLLTVHHTDDLRWIGRYREIVACDCWCRWVLWCLLFFCVRVVVVVVVGFARAVVIWHHPIFGEGVRRDFLWVFFCGWKKNEKRRRREKRQEGERERERGDSMLKRAGCQGRAHSKVEHTTQAPQSILTPQVALCRVQTFLVVGWDLGKETRGREIQRDGGTDRDWLKKINGLLWRHMGVGHKKFQWGMSWVVLEYGAKPEWCIFRGCMRISLTTSQI